MLYEFGTKWKNLETNIRQKRHTIFTTRYAGANALWDFRLNKNHLPRRGCVKVMY
jgi:hypothetical protein